MSETDNHEVEDLNQRLAAVKPPFVASEYVGLPGDRILFVAHDPHTGICCAGRESSDEAQYDAQGMRAAWWLGYAAAMEVIKARAAQCDMDFYGYSTEEAERAFCSAGLKGDCRRRSQATASSSSAEAPDLTWTGASFSKSRASASSTTRLRSTS